MICHSCNSIVYSCRRCDMVHCDCRDKQCWYDYANSISSLESELVDARSLQNPRYTRNRDWKATIRGIKSHFEDWEEGQPVKPIAEATLDKLISFTRKQAIMGRFDRNRLSDNTMFVLRDIVGSLEEFIETGIEDIPEDDMDVFNQILSDLYDWSDEYSVWIE